MFNPITPGNAYGFEFTLTAPDANGKRGSPLSGQSLRAYLTETDGGAPPGWAGLDQSALPEYTDTRPGTYHGQFSGTATMQVAAFKRVYIVVIDGAGNILTSNAVPVLVLRRAE